MRKRNGCNGDYPTFLRKPVKNRKLIGSDGVKRSIRNITGNGEMWGKKWFDNLDSCQQPQHQTHSPLYIRTFVQQKC